MTDTRKPQPPYTRRPNPVFGTDYRCLVEGLIEARIEAGLSQRALAAAIGRSQSHLCMIERGQRRIDVLELCKMAAALGHSPGRLMERISRSVA